MAVAFFSLIDLIKQVQTAASTIKGDRERISHCVKSGALTKAQTATLAAQTARLENEKEVYKTNNVITAEETKNYKQNKRKSVKIFITKSKTNKSGHK